MFNQDDNYITKNQGQFTGSPLNDDLSQTLFGRVHQMPYFFPLVTPVFQQPMMLYPMQQTQMQHNSPKIPHKGILELERFKITECHIKTYHDHKQCPFFHSLKDKRRDLKKHYYEPDSCSSVSEAHCRDGINCKRSHNTVEQFYHPKKYKTKLCSHYPDGIKDCCYGTFCSFAHAESELKIPLLHKKIKDTNFFIYEYKTVYCPFNNQHDKSSCEYAHNVQDYRRDPRKFSYKPDICKKWNVSSEISSYAQGGCPLNVDCKKCHGWKELEYHPASYKTKQCINNESCSRSDCGYFHSQADRRDRSDRKGNSAQFNEKTCASTKEEETNYNAEEPMMTLESSINTLASHDLTVALKRPVASDTENEVIHDNEPNQKEQKETSKTIKQRNARFNIRKFSQQHFSEDNRQSRFCLKSEDEATLTDFNSLQFWSPLKMRAEFGPENAILQPLLPKEKAPPKTCPTSPTPALQVLSEMKPEKLVPSADLIDLLKRSNLDERELFLLQEEDILHLEDINNFERQQLLLWKDRLQDEGKDNDIFRLIDDFNGSEFYKED